MKSTILTFVVSLISFIGFAQAPAGTIAGYVMHKQTKAKIAEKYIILDAILIRSVTLPDNLRTAIEKKLEEEQLSLQYKFKIDRERQEGERRIIEAQAKADANRILNASLTDKILRDKGIEATLTLAASPNAKVVVVGGSGDGLPLILNN